MGKFNRIFHHITVEDVKSKWSDSLEESIARQFKEDEEKRIVNELVDEIKSDWKSELSDLWKQDWRDKLNEGMTTSDTFSYSISGKGDVDLTTTGTGYQDGIHQLANIEPMTNVSDPTNAGKHFSRTHGYGARTYGGINQYDNQTKADAGIEANNWNQAVTGPLLDHNTNLRFTDYIYPFDRDATQAEMDIGSAASKVRGQNDSFRAVYPTNVIYNQGHKTTPVVTNPTVGTDDAYACLLYTSPSPRDVEECRMPSSA